MTSLSLFLTAVGGAFIAGGAAILVGFLVGVRRGTRSANAEYGYMSAVPVAFGLWLVDWGVGWPGWPAAYYFLIGICLTVLFAIAIVCWGCMNVR
jgi:hypothetical protein